MATFKAKDGTQIYYKDCGAGKPVLFSHGWPLDGDMWDSQLNYLAERGFRAIAFDRRGFGRSDQPWNGYDYDTFASDINDLVTTLDLQDVTLVGFSMGGGDVTRYINNYGSARVAGLALLGAVTPIFGKSETFPQGVDPQQHAVKIAQFGPADIARQQAQPPLVIMDKRAAEQFLFPGGQ